MQLGLFSGFLLAQAWLGSCMSIPENNDLMKRKAETNATLYAYGANSSAWPIASGRTDGMS